MHDLSSARRERRSPVDLDIATIAFAFCRAGAELHAVDLGCITHLLRPRGTLQWLAGLDDVGEIAPERFTDINFGRRAASACAEQST